jgi:hypothetical protein
MGLWLACLLTLAPPTTAPEQVRFAAAVDALVGNSDRYPPAVHELRVRSYNNVPRFFPGSLDWDEGAAEETELSGRHDAAIPYLTRAAAHLMSQQPPNRRLRDHCLVRLATAYANRALDQPGRAGAADLEAALGQLRDASSGDPDLLQGPGYEDNLLRRESLAYEAMAIDWWAHPPERRPGGPLPDFISDGLAALPEELRTAICDQDALSEAAHLTALFDLGPRWEDVDVFHAISVALARQPGTAAATLALLAQLRAQELARGGERSRYPDAPRDEALVRALDLRQRLGLSHAQRDRIVALFPKVRHEVEMRLERRAEFLLRHFRPGEDPADDVARWLQWQEPAMPALDAVRGTPARPAAVLPGAPTSDPRPRPWRLWIAVSALIAWRCLRRFFRPASYQRVTFGRPPDAH